MRARNPCRRILLLVGAAALVIGAASACASRPVYLCHSNAECVSENGSQGLCEPDQFCSFADSTCEDTGRRYADGAGNGLASACVVPQSGTSSCIARLSAGAEHFCAIRSTDETVWCWGMNQEGELGDGTNDDRAQPVAARLPSKRYVEVAAAETHSCALADDGTVYCWGANDKFQLGVAGPGRATPVAVTVATTGPTPVAITVDHVSAGGAHTCVIGHTPTVSGQVYCWGENSDGQCGQNKDTFDDVPVPMLVKLSVNGQTSNSGNVVALSVGDEHSAALKDDRHVYSWGLNSEGQLGTGTASNSDVGLPALFESAASLASGDEHVCIAKADDTVWCYGYGSSVGDGNSVNVASPVQVGVARLVASGGSAFHTCAVREDGALQCWGQNDTGQVGAGFIDPGNVFVLRPTAALLITVSRADNQVALSNHSSCALTQDGLLWCWGANDHGQLGQGSSGPPSPVPQRAAFPCE